MTPSRTAAGSATEARSFAPDRLAAPHDGFERFGPLARVLADPAVTDVFINGHRSLWVDRGAGATPEPVWDCPSEERLREFAIRLVAQGGRHIDEATPCVDVRVAGLRVHVVLPPLAPGGTLVSIRVPQRRWPRLHDLDQRGLFGAGPEGLARRAVVERAVRDRVNVLVTGAGGSGKTTLLSALLAEAPPSERIVVIEDVTELRIDHPHVVALEARQPNLEGAGGIGLPELLRQSLRMRPDRLVLGECRGAEIRELLGALNTGHDGGAGTLHANTLADVPARLEALGALGGMDATAVARQAVSAIGLICHLRRTERGRVIEAFGRLRVDDRDRLAVSEIDIGEIDMTQNAMTQTDIAETDIAETEIAETDIVETETETDTETATAEVDAAESEITEVGAAPPAGATAEPHRALAEGDMLEGVRAARVRVGRAGAAQGEATAAEGGRRREV